jgi:hypothetical protein
MAAACHLRPCALGDSSSAEASRSVVNRMTWSEIFMINKSANCFAGFTGLLGGLYLYFHSNSLGWLAEGLHSLPNPAATLLVKSAFWCVMSLCLTLCASALLTLGSPETSWQHRLGVIGSIVTLLGVVAYLIGCVYVLILLVEHYAYFLYQGFYFG